MIREIKINGKWTFSDYGMYIAEAPVVEFPELQSYKINVPFRNGDIDMTNYLGEPTFNNRKIEFEFFFTDYDKLARFTNEVHGKRCKISINQPYYFIGTVTLQDFTPSESDNYVRGKLVADCEPFKYLDRIKGFNLSNLNKGRMIRITNRGYSTVATFKGNAVINIGEEQYTISGTNKIKLPRGNITIRLESSATTLSCEFKERYL